MSINDKQLALYKRDAIRLICQMEVGLFDFENNGGLLDFLGENYYGPVFVPVIKRENRHEKFDILRREFREKFEIDISSKDFLVLRLESKLLGSCPFVAFRKPLVRAQ